MNSNLCSGDEMGSAEDVYQSWSPRSPDLPLGTSDPYRAQHPNQPTYTSGEAPPTASQHSSSSYDANHVSYHNILCTNRAYCSSKCCEMQKRTIAKSSPVWKYFSLKEGDCSKAVCLMCRAVISRGRKEYTTSALLKHLRMKHGKCWHYHDIILCSLILCIHIYICCSGTTFLLSLFNCLNGACIIGNIWGHHLCVIPAGNVLIFGSAEKRRMKEITRKTVWKPLNRSRSAWTLASVRYGEPLSEPQWLRNILSFGVFSNKSFHCMEWVEWDRAVRYVSIQLVIQAFWLWIQMKQLGNMS